MGLRVKGAQMRPRVSVCVCVCACAGFMSMTVSVYVCVCVPRHACMFLSFKCPMFLLSVVMCARVIYLYVYLGVFI